MREGKKRRKRRRKRRGEQSNEFNRFIEKIRKNGIITQKITTKNGKEKDEKET